MTNAIQRRNNERTLALLFIATALIFGLYGTGIGSLMLATLSGFSIPISSLYFSSHPYAQIYGFIFQFIMGVAYILLPRFKGERIKSVTLAFISYIMVTLANLGFILPVSFSSYWLSSIASSLFLFGVLIFSWQTLSLAFRERGGFPETNPLIAESALAASLSTIVLFIANNSWLKVPVENFSYSSIYLTLLGFASSMIYAVEIRMVSLRQRNYRPLWANLTWLSQGIAIITSFTSALTSSHILLIIGQVSFIFAAISASISLKLFDIGINIMRRASMSEVHYRIMNYNEFSMILAFIWLFIASATGMIISFNDLNSYTMLDSSSLYIRDLFIHAIAIGFIGSTILCYAPLLLPGLLSMRGPTRGLSYYPILVLNVATLIRAAGDLYALGSGYMPSWEAISGPLILISILWSLWMIRHIGR